MVVVDSAPSPKRAMCPRCERPETVCLCDAMVQVNSPVEVIIWQDPTEARHKLSTAPLLHKSLPGSRLLVADELLSELDPLTVKLVMNQVKSLQNESNTTIILIEHNIEVAAKYADVIVVINEGKIISQFSSTDTTKMNEIKELITL